MTLLALLMGLVYPACARPGAEGLPAPVPIEPAAIVRPRSPNTALVAPPGLGPVPDIAAPTYAMPAAALYRALRDVAAHEPRATLQAAYDDRLQAQYVVRSAVLNFPDLVMVEALPAGPQAATLVVWSRSVYGWGDMGANRRRAQAWLAALATLPAVAQAGLAAPAPDAPSHPASRTAP